MRILLVRLASLGDVVHAMPVVRDIRARHPNAVVDWVVEPAFAPLLRRVEGIGDVIEAPLRRWRANWWKAKTRSERRAFRARLRRESYDAVIDLQGQTASALIAWSARGRHYGIANRTDGAQHDALSRWLADLAIALPARMHAMDAARLLVSRVLATDTAARPDYGLRSPMPKARQPTVVFAHGSSREDRLWPESRWVALGRRFTDAGWQIALPHGSEVEQVRAERLAAQIDSEATAFGESRPMLGQVQVWPRLALDALADRLAACHGAVGVDGGVSKLAVALGLPHLQLYLRPDAWRSGPLREHGHAQQRALGGDAVPGVEEVWSAWQDLLRPVAAKRR